MREILFRGKELDGGDWVEGYLIRNDNICYPALFIGMIEASLTRYGELSIDGHYLPQVDPDTVGQYTGMTDKNGKRIFEGDIVVIYSDEKNPVQIVFLESSWMAVMPKYSYYRHRLEDIKDKYEVIGNIHDNPELIAEVEG